MNQYSTGDHSVTRVHPRCSWHRALLTFSGLLLIGAIGAACGSSSSTPAAVGVGTSVALVATTNNDHLGTILVDSKGFTLYALRGNAPCDSACNAIWPPLLVTANAKPTLGSGVTGLATTTVSGGEQVTYHGMLLYTFTGDASPGQVNGQGLKDTWGTWFAVVTKALTASPTTAPTTTPPAGGTPSTTGGGGGGIGF
jgi:predicted lipoprotein with Yx(FWY)xxD motif